MPVNPPRRLGGRRRGPVVARVFAVPEAVSYDAEPWWHVRAEVTDGTPTGTL